MTSKNYYKILGLQSSASEKEIRRAYRILARRYHPDVNPNVNSQNDSSNKFQLIAEAYSILSDTEKRRQHDLELTKESFFNRPRNGDPKPKGHKEYAEEMRRKFQAQSQVFQDARKKHSPKQPPPSRRPMQPYSSTPGDWLKKIKEVLTTPIGSVTGRGGTAKKSTKSESKNNKEKFARSISILEVSLSLEEAIKGTKKTLEIDGGAKPQKVSVKIPSGVYNGSVIRMKSGNNSNEELVLIIQLAHHPYLSLDRNGLTIELPVTINEAYKGTSIQVPTLENPVMLKVPPRSRNGTLIRIKDKGPKNRDGGATDLLYKIAVQAPPGDVPPQYENLMEEFENCYSSPVRSEMPQKLVETNS